MHICKPVLGLEDGQQDRFVPMQKAPTLHCSASAAYYLERNAHCDTLRRAVKKTSKLLL